MLTGKKHAKKLKSKAESSREISLNQPAEGSLHGQELSLDIQCVGDDAEVTDNILRHSKKDISEQDNVESSQELGELKNLQDSSEMENASSDMEFNNLSIELDSEEEMVTEDRDLNSDVQNQSYSGNPARDNGIRWGSCYPMAGGGDFGYKEAFNSEPLFFITDSAFKKNQKYLTQLFPQVPQFTMEQLPDCFKKGDLDVVTCLCPCAGLSTLNKSKGNKKPGSGAPQNEYLKKSLKFVLSEVKPAVFVGESSDKLFTLLGSDLVAELARIGKEYGYACSLYMTCTSQHGLPQKRKRTFYFFWKSGVVSRLEWVDQGHPDLKEFLDLIPVDATLQNVFINSWKPTDFKPYKILLELSGKTHGKLEQTNPCGQTVFTLLKRLGLIEKVTERLETSDTATLRLEKLAAE